MDRGLWHQLLVVANSRVLLSFVWWEPRVAWQMVLPWAVLAPGHARWTLRRVSTDQTQLRMARTPGRWSP